MEKTLFVDTHCHLDCIAAFGDENSVINSERLVSIIKFVDEAKNLNVKKIINVGCDFLTSKNSVELARKFENVFAVVGAHPYEGRSGWKNEFGLIKNLLKGSRPEDKIVGIGEIGLDYSRKTTEKDCQKDFLKAQLELALESNLPISFHVRDAADDFLKIIEPYHKDIRGVIHCFQQTLDFAKVVTGWGLFIGIDGPITYPKNIELCQVVEKIDLSFIVLETDSPYLPVQAERGKINYPSKIPLIAQKVAEIKGASLSVVAEQTTKNAVELFGLSLLPRP